MIAQDNIKRVVKLMKEHDAEYSRKTTTTGIPYIRANIEIFFQGITIFVGTNIDAHPYQDEVERVSNKKWLLNHNNRWLAIQEAHYAWFSKLYPKDWKLHEKYITAVCDKIDKLNKLPGEKDTNCFIGMAFIEGSHNIFVHQILNDQPDLFVAYILLHEIGHLHAPKPNGYARKLYKVLDDVDCRLMRKKLGKLTNWEKEHIFHEKYADTFAYHRLKQLIEHKYITNG